MRKILVCLFAVLVLTARGGEPQPMFLYYFNPDHMQVVYWTEYQEPQRTADNAEYFDQWYSAWALQNSVKTHADGYTKMVIGGGRLIDIKYKDELLKNPDGEDMYPGELHSRPSIPSPGLRFALVDRKQAPRREYDYGELFVILHKDYLNTHRMVKTEYTSGERPMPASVIRQMEQKYGMKAARSMQVGKIAGRYIQGFIQFAGEYKNAPVDANHDYKKALALEVLIDGSKVYTIEKLGYYDDGYCTWNADDGGEYCPTAICAAFEGPDGLDLCYEHGAPESRTVGMYHLRNGQFTEQNYAVYHAMVDEQTPLWKKDIATLQKLYDEENPECEGKFKLTKYRWIDIDDDGIEELWMRDKDDVHGALFCQYDGTFHLICSESDKQQFYFLQQRSGMGYVRHTNTTDESHYCITVFSSKKSFFSPDFAMVNDGGHIEAWQGDRILSNVQATNMLDKLPPKWDVYIYWHDMEE